ncbi:MAG: sigma-70 family RNA polymerase sigma factor [Armatimonadetes bacterium]|nr:sigma-70 family RNA polymerase sigma factor [Candidatus Hippobium faecium]
MIDMKENDAELLLLIKRCKRGNMIAFDTLMQKYQAAVFGYAFKLCNNYEDANDITNETFIKLIDVIKTFNEESRFKGWLFTVVKNIYIDRLRSEKKINVVSINEGEDGEQIEIKDEAPNPEILLIDEEKKKILHRLIDELPLIQRDPIRLFYLEGKSYQQISDILGTPMGTIKSRINRGIETLKDKFMEQYVHPRELPRGRQSSLPPPKK